MLELEETKLFLRVDGSEEDSVISSLIITGTELVAGVLRRDLTEFEILPETIKQAILVVVATLFEGRRVKQICQWHICSQSRKRAKRTRPPQRGDK